MSDIFNTFESDVKKIHDDLIEALESISVDDVRSSGVTLSFGGKTLRFTDFEVIPDNELETNIRNEYKTELNQKTNIIRTKINNKVSQIYVMLKQKQEEFDRKAKKLADKYKNTSVMPDLDAKLLMKGLSVVKGDEHGELIWMYKGTYAPKFMILYDDNGSKVDKKRRGIPKEFQKRLEKPIWIEVRTKGVDVLSICTKEDDPSLPKMKHYHQTSTGNDCWGTWSKWKEVKCNSAEDVYMLCKDAEAVLETINQGSIATENPTGCPRLATLLSHVKKANIKYGVKSLNDDNEDEDVWEV